VEVEVNGNVQTMHVSKTGRFSLSLPAGLEAVLRFEHPGHLTKEVLVDTHFARTGEPGKHKRHIRFAVILELECLLNNQHYAGPVGSITFDKEGGCAAVDHNRKLIPWRKNKPMVF
jgi:hypothetical protein